MQSLWVRNESFFGKNIVFIVFFVSASMHYSISLFFRASVEIGDIHSREKIH